MPPLAGRVLAVLLVGLMLGICAPAAASAQGDVPAGIVAAATSEASSGCSGVTGEAAGLPTSLNVHAVPPSSAVVAPGPAVSREIVAPPVVATLRPVFLDVAGPRAPPRA